MSGDVLQKKKKIPEENPRNGKNTKQRTVGICV